MTGHHTTHPVEAVAYFLQGRGRESGVQARIYFYAIFLRSVNGKAYRQYGSFANHLFFLVDES
jgi:hypothetical protein